MWGRGDRRYGRLRKDVASIGLIDRLYQAVLLPPPRRSSGDERSVIRNRRTRWTPGNFSAKVGYAGGTAPSSGPVCYHTGDSRDYSLIGMAEATRIVLDEKDAIPQMKALAKDFFDSFRGAAGQRTRPDPGDQGPMYRSMAGLPGGISPSSPLYAAFAAENTHGMSLKPGQGSDQDEVNTVWVYDSDQYPFFEGEVYHQAHCDFSMSSGMPYPKAYTQDVWNQHQADGGYYANLWSPTGCPESHGGISHPGSLCSSSSGGLWG